MKDILKGITYICIFAVPFVVLMVTGSMFFPYITGKNFAFRILIEIATASWILLALLDARYRPKFSWIAVSGLALLGIMFFANLFGEYPAKSFWSNYERMEGYVTLVHFYFYFLLLGTMLTTEKLWNRFFNTTLAAAVLVCFYAFAQLAGSIEISQGGAWRVDATLGNSTYMAVYMLFHIFIVALMAVRTRTSLRYGYIGLALLFVFILFQTGTRGAALGLGGGVFLATIYLVLFARGYPQVRKIGLGILVALVLAVGGLIALKESTFVQQTPALARLANISLADGSIRLMIWEIALQGVAERPFLGWGQENFSYVFNEKYNPELYRAEAWYDRTHNIIFDWLIAGGIFGALAYFSLYLAALFHSVIRPLIDRVKKKRDPESHFSIIEQAMLLGLLGAYFIHNLFVFDNLISYIFFAVTLAFVHSRIATALPQLQAIRIDRSLIEQIGTPVVILVLIFTVYVVNVPAILAAKEMIDAFRVQDPEERLALFKRALARETFGTQEITEQLSEQAMGVAAAPDVSDDMKGRYLTSAEEALLRIIAKKPGDPRFHIFLSGVYQAAGKFTEGKEQLTRAQELSPGKVSLVIEQGILALKQQDAKAMKMYMEQAYQMVPDFPRARIMYAASLIYNSDVSQLPELITEPYMLNFASESAVLYATQERDVFTDVDGYFTSYIAAHPEATIPRVARAQLFYSFKLATVAKNILDEAARAIPSFESSSACYKKNIDDGAALTEGCV